MLGRILFISLLLPLFVGCSSSESNEGSESGSEDNGALECTPNETMPCECAEGVPGQQTCGSTGSNWSACSCMGDPESDATTGDEETGGESATDAETGGEDTADGGDPTLCGEVSCGENGTCEEDACACKTGWAGAACDELADGARPFSTEGIGAGILDTVEDFTVPTMDGVWSFSENWSGLENHLFLFKFSGSSGGDANPTAVWNTDVAAFLNRTPTNTHVFFGSYDNTWMEDIAAMKERVDAALGAMPQAISKEWVGKIHYVQTPIVGLNGGMKAFIGEHGATFWFAIDRLQRWRQVGSLFDWRAYYQEEPQANWYPMEFVAHEAIHFNYEAERKDLLEASLAQGGLEVPFWTEGDVHGGGWGAGVNSWWDLELPEASALADFDTLYIVHGQRCPSHLQGKENGCPEWDRTEHLYLCDTATALLDFEATASCEAASEGTPAETRVCGLCQTPHGPTHDATQTCNAEGTEFGECSCGCGTELARWITTYAREGWWVTDISPLLPLVQTGGKRTIRLHGVNSYAIEGSLVFANEGKAMRPVKADYLWGKPNGTGFNPEYNTVHPDVSFEIGEATSRVEIFAVISGHGSGTTSENCAEFCDHTHHYTVDGGAEHVESHPGVNSWYGCRDQTHLGGVPNQFGTWIFGRAGWCAGMDVQPWVKDITADALPGTHTMEYRSYLAGQDYTPSWTGQGDYNPEIRMSSWLIQYEPAN